MKRGGCPLVRGIQNRKLTSQELRGSFVTLSKGSSVIQLIACAHVTQAFNIRQAQGSRQAHIFTVSSLQRSSTQAPKPSYSRKEMPTPFGIMTMPLDVTRSSLVPNTSKPSWHLVRQVGNYSKETNTCLPVSGVEALAVSGGGLFG